MRALSAGILLSLVLFFASGANAQSVCSYPYSVGFTVTTIAVQGCLALPNPRLIDACATAFLDAYLKGRFSPFLSGSGAGLLDWEHAP